MENHSPSRAKTFFDKINMPGNGAKFLTELASSTPPTFESEFLEFKGGHNLKKDSPELAKKWAKYLSCFANSDGGVLIFGIDAPEGGKAKSLSLVQDVTGIQDNLKKLLGTVTEPPVQGVQIEVYRESPNASTGYVVCYIPASPWRPHQARPSGGPDHFYIRAVDHCVPCNHSTLRALFVPQFVSRLEIYYQSIIDGESVLNLRTGDVFLRCWVGNAGPATASEVLVQYEKPFKVTDTPRIVGIWEPTASEEPIHALLAMRSIHPEERVRLFDIKLGNISKTGVKQFSNDTFTFNFSISARNQVPLKYTLTLRAQEVEDDVIKKGILMEGRS